MINRAKGRAFLLAVRKLETSHGIYLETSEWLSLRRSPPAPDDGVFAAAYSAEATPEELARAAGQEIKTDEEYENDWADDQD